MPVSVHDLMSPTFHKTQWQALLCEPELQPLSFAALPTPPFFDNTSQTGSFAPPDFVTLENNSTTCTHHSSFLAMPSDCAEAASFSDGFRVCRKGPSVADCRVRQFLGMGAWGVKCMRHVSQRGPACAGMAPAWQTA